GGATDKSSEPRGRRRSCNKSPDWGGAVSPKASPRNEPADPCPLSAAHCFPGAASLDVGGLGADNPDPFLDCLGEELRSVVGPDVSENALQDEEVGQNVDHIDHIDRLELAGDTDRQAFMAELVEHVEHPVLASLVGAVLDKVVGPDMIALLRTQPNARSVGQPEPAALGLLMGNLQPLTLPDTLDPLVVDCPARLAQQRGCRLDQSLGAFFPHLFICCAIRSITGCHNTCCPPITTLPPPSHLLLL